MKTVSAKDALVRLETLCARSEQSTGEAREKLRRWGICSGDAEKIIDSLVDRRFIDNERFALAFARDKIRFSKWGRIKVAQKLREKGVGRDTIAETLDEFDEEEYKTILADVLASRVRRDPGQIESYEGRTALFRFLLSRGFESQLAAAAIRAAKASMEMG